MTNKKINQTRYKAALLFNKSVNGNSRFRIIKNLLWYGEFVAKKRRKYWGEKLGITIPSLMILDITSKCNLKCVGCYAREYKIDHAPSFDSLDKVIIEAKKLGIYYIVFSGGEPFIAKENLLRLIQKHTDVIFSSFTNGTLIDDECIQSLVSAGNIMLGVSIEGLENSTDTRRGAGVFQKTLQTMEMLHKHKMPFGYSVTYTKYNAEEVVSKSFVDLMAERGNRYGIYLLFHPVTPDDLHLLPTPEQREYVHERIKEIRNEQNIAVADHHDGYLVGGCVAGLRYIHINAKGDLEGCPMIHFASGNVYETSLMDALSSPLIKEFQAMERKDRNMLCSCPLLDHPMTLRSMLQNSGAYPTHSGMKELVFDKSSELDVYANSWSQIASQLWKRIKNQDEW